MHEGFERLQVIQGILKPIIGFYLRHTELWCKGERSDKCSKGRVYPVDQFVEVVWHPSPKSFIMKSILSFIIYISATMCGGAVSVTDEWLVSCHSCLLIALFPSSPFQSLLSALVLSYSFRWWLGPVFLWRNCSSKSWFCLVTHSTAAARVCTCLSRAVVCGLSPWLLLVAIEYSEYHTTLCLGSGNMATSFSSPQTTPIGDAKNC